MNWNESNLMELIPAIIVGGAVIALVKIFSDSPDKRIQEALRAMKRVLKTRKQNPHVLYREDIGWIGFSYGAHYPATKTRKRSGYGLAHIIGAAKENFGKYEGSPSPEEVLSLIPEIILRGQKRDTHKNRILIEYKGHIALLTKRGKRQQDPHWLFHAYKRYPKK